MKNCERYPFIPKSTSYMLEGQFFDIPLSTGKFACGRVLQFDYSSGKKDTRSFLAGLIDWIGEDFPTSESIAGAKLLEQGDAHIRTISFVSGAIRGVRSLEDDNIEPILSLSQLPTCDCRLKRGYLDLRLATLEEKKSLRIHTTWGLGVIKILAEIYFVEKRIPVRELPWDRLMNMTIPSPKIG